jgi:UDP-glucose 4-epimerase
MKVLVTGGAGYIGGTTVRALAAAGHVPVVLDSLLTGRPEFAAGVAFYRGDVADRALLRRIVDDHPDDEATIHMAARIVVPESVAQPYGRRDRELRRGRSGSRPARVARRAHSRRRDRVGARLGQTS